MLELSPEYPIYIFSGCRYADCGSAQRPSALARSFAKMGYRVYYHNRLEKSTNICDVIVLTKQAANRAVRRHRGPGLCIITLTEYLDLAMALYEAGCTLVYDLLDDWDSFVHSGDLHPYILQTERDLISKCHVVTCSAPRLLTRARRLGAKRVHLVPNAGPDYSLPLKPKEYDWVYSGYLYGSWMDWSGLRVLADAGLTGLVIGRHSGLPDMGPNVKFVGELDHRDALEMMGSARVGVIPFMGELCRSVDPIKYYDYAAMGLWTVSTPIVEPMASHPWSTLATVWPHEGFIQAVRDGIEKVERGEGPPEDAWKGNTWDDRARELLNGFNVQEVSEVSISDLESRPIRVMDESLWKLRATWMAPAICDMVPPCPYCCTIADRHGKEPIGAPAEDFIRAWLRLGDQVGYMFLSICFGEPMSHEPTRRIVAAVAREHRVDIVSNMLAPLEHWEPLGELKNVAVAMSYHWHHWPVEEFIAKQRAVANLGVRTGIVSVVMYPEFGLERWQRDIETLKSEGFYVDAIPFWGWWNGREYPYSYNEEEQEFLKSIAHGFQDGPETYAASLGKMCRVGKDYIAVNTKGDVYRCYMLGDTLMGSLFDEDFRLMDAPAPCPFQRCPCRDMWQFMEGDAMP